MIKIHTYKEAYLLNVTVMGDGINCWRDDPVQYHKRDVINKMACYLSGGSIYEDLVGEIYDMTSDTSVPPGAKLYVASECGTGRDTFRNSGYSICRDPANANAIVIPDISAKKYHCLSCNFVARGYDEVNDEEQLFLITVYKSGYHGKEITEEDVKQAKNYVKSAMALEVDDVDDYFIKVWFIPKCKELQDVMEEHTYNVPYVQESLVPVNPSTQFSAETLLFWENIDDTNLLIRTICTSDWMKYPTTLWCFLLMYENSDRISNWFTVATGDFRRILNSIGYDSYDSFKYKLVDRSMTAEDYDMLQSYLYLKMGVSEEGGMVDPKHWQEIDSDLKKLLQRRYVVKPFHIPSKMSVKNIMQMFR